MASRRNLDSICTRRTPAGAAMLRAALGLALGLGGTTLAASAAHAQSAASGQAASARSYAIPAGPLDQALTRYASEAGVELSVDAALTRGKSTAGLQGRYGVQDGFARLLQGQGLRVVQGAGGAYSLRPAPAQLDGATTLPAVTVTGSAENGLERGGRLCGHAQRHRHQDR